MKVSRWRSILALTNLPYSERFLAEMIARATRESLGGVMKNGFIAASMLACLATSVTHAGAEEGSARYACSFASGASWSADGTSFTETKSAPLSFEISKISRKNRTAELTTDTGRTDVKLVAAIDALHFIEVTVSGYLTLTTIYGDGKKMPAVHSRHLGIVGQPVGGQLTGYCERK